MLSRRIVRVKVMQLLYSLNSDRKLKPNEVIENYKKGVEDSYELLLFTVYALVKITRIALEEEERRKAKLLPGEDDKNFVPKLYDNPLIKELEESSYLTKIVEKNKFANSADTDLIRQIYRKYAKQDSYKEYVYSNSDTIESHRKGLLDLFRFVRKNDIFEELVESRFSHWEDDRSLIIGAVKKIVKALPSGKDDLVKEFYPDEDTWKDFGLFLLEKTIEEDRELRHTLNPALKNWDEDRLTTIDNILLKMALCEFMFFPSIPTTVTINEYMEVAKLYSTARSKDFINGLLDRLTGDLEEMGKLNKVGRGLKQ